MFKDVFKAPKISKKAPFKSTKSRKGPSKTLQQKAPNSHRETNKSHHTSLSNLIFPKRVLISDQPPVPPLANNLDRVLFSPGVHFLKDPRTNVYNFPTQLENIMSIRDFDFTKIAAFVPSGRDNKLAKMAKERNKRYTGSTSSLTGALTKLHFALSHNRPPHIMHLSKFFPDKTTTFSAAQSGTTLLHLVYNPATKTYAVQSDGTHDKEIILSLLGHAMETMLVTDTKTFANYDRRLSHLLPNEEATSTYNYMECGPLLMRSQLDCYDSRLPGSGFFDLKTRAVCAVRHDIDYAQIHDGSYYQLRQRDGAEESYAVEQYELVRSALFKYSLQARIGSMDGIFVAYHNIKTLFGFEYLPLSEIDPIYHTSHLINPSGRDHPQLHSEMAKIGPIIAEKEFSLSLDILTKILDKIVASAPSPKHSFNLAIQCTAPGRIVVLVKPMIAEHLEKPVEEPCQSDSYKLNKDPSTMSQHRFNGDPQFIPPDVYGFMVQLESTINGEPVPISEHPNIRNEQDNWSVDFTIENMANVPKMYQKVMSKVVHQELTSTPLTDRVEDEELVRDLALAKLPDANKFQSRFRELQEKGQLYKRWDDKREKLIWKPRGASSD